MIALWSQSWATFRPITDRSDRSVFSCHAEKKVFNVFNAASCRNMLHLEQIKPGALIQLVFCFMFYNNIFGTSWIQHLKWTFLTCQIDIIFNLSKWHHVQNYIYIRHFILDFHSRLTAENTTFSIIVFRGKHQIINSLVLTDVNRKFWRTMTFRSE